MAKADCAFCEASGYRSCDKCGNVVFSLEVLGANGEELCGYCLDDLGIEQPLPAWMKDLPPDQLAKLR